MTTSPPSQTSTTSSTADLRSSLDLFEIKPGVRFSLATLQALLPDAETVLFFGKVYDLSAQQLGNLLHKVLRTTLTTALFDEGGIHSNALQSYILDTFGDEDWFCDAVSEGKVNYQPDVAHGEILPHLWAQLEVEVAASIKAVAAKLEGVVGMLPGKQGSMVFRQLMTVNAKRPILGDYRAQVSHARQVQNLVILDVSGSMTSGTVKQIVEDVVAMSYEANAHFAIVSNTCTYWTPGTYGVADILREAEYGGTQYEQLAPLFDRDWGTVITVADYDSSPAAKQALSSQPGRIEQVLDISLVNRPTYLAECVGQLAQEVRPLLIGTSAYVLS